ncbi:MAG: L-serine ammonia-lyase, iron-sulfur-dependent, subunit alpha [Eubacteriales bacterium]|nr:L-serine ammonia-lyase, iron-sulfur-dependent, subunit alpha [Eubacteriales bacterium]
MHELTRLIREDMKPALGVTEPGAIAYAVASARAYTEGPVEKVKVALNSGMYKNAYTCGIPNSNEYGNLYAAALGAVAADASLGLESLACITAEDNRRARQLVEEGLVEVTLDHMGSEITIDAEVWTAKDVCSVHIRNNHTDIRWIEKNGRVIRGQKAERLEEPDAQEEEPLIHQYSLREILHYVRTVSTEEISFIREAFSVNMDLLEESALSDRTAITAMLIRDNGNTIISRDARKTAQLLCNGAIEGRVLGLAKPAMSITGSGAHGIIATMPLFAFYQVNREKMDEDSLLRATALSFLITMYIKEYSGRLSAFCGCGIAAGTGMACGLGYLQNAEDDKITMIIQNMASGLTGMICDGGNQGCAMKGIVAVDAAFRAVDMAMEGVCIDSIHGINGRTPEDTMRHMGMIASPGMVKTEEVIVEIMKEK